MMDGIQTLKFWVSHRTAIKAEATRSLELMAGLIGTTIVNFELIQPKD